MMTANEATEKVVLTAKQMEFAAGIAARLHEKIRARGGKDAHGGRVTQEQEAGGAQAELALSIFLGVEWSASSPGHRSKGPDVGRRTQVRSSFVPRSSHHLIVRSRDVEKYGLDSPFVLVIQTGCEFEIKGWATAGEVIEKGRLWDGGNGNRPECWFLHESLLNPIGTLKDP